MPVRRSADSFLIGLAKKGRNHFVFEEYVEEQEVSEVAAKSAIRRLKEEEKIVSPFAKFYVLLEPRQAAIGCPPPSHFIDALMAYLDRGYYVSLLSAGEYHSAAHQRPQAFQVMTDDYMNEINCGRVRIEFIKKADLKDVPVEKRNTPVGYMNVSTPEATVFDLVDYEKRSGGLNNVATVISELAEKLDSNKLIAVSRLYKTPVLQRLGYILERVGFLELSLVVAREVERLMPRYTPLFTGMEMSGASRERRFRLAINDTLEPDL